MKIEIKENFKTFKLLTDLLGKNILETKLSFDKDGLSIFGNSHGLAAIRLAFKPEFFETYEITGDEEAFGIILKDLSVPLKKMKTEVCIEDNENKLVIKSGKDKYTLPIIEDITSDIREMPVLEHTLEYATTFNKLVEVFDKMSFMKHDEVAFSFKDGMLMASCIDGTREFTTEVMESEEFEGELLFSIPLVNNFLGKTDDELTVKMGPDKPIQLNYEKDGATMEVLVAPRVRK